jgi:nicotinate-nucleotide pyrophosphorylase (carboxylating)
MSKRKFGVSSKQVMQTIDLALAEDHVSNDVTTRALIPEHFEGKAIIIAKGDGVLAGIEVAKAVFVHVDPTLSVDLHIADGSRVKRGDIVMTIIGDVSAILKAERTALNFLCHLSGIATETSRYVDAVRGLNVRILDTRKTMPGLRPFEKDAVRAGGGQNHREHLGGWVLIKNNHLAALRSLGLGVAEAVARGRAGASSGDVAKVEIEVESVDAAREALAAGADIIMLDNMSIDDMKRTVGFCKGKVLLEASGGINLSNVRAVAETGVDLISLGAITHSAKVLDMSLKLKI